MSNASSFPDPLRPVAPQVKWWIVGTAFLLLGLWELTFHTWMMRLPMITGHRLNAFIAGCLVAVTVLANFILVQGYEERLHAATLALKEKNEALRALEAERDTRLLDLSRDLALALTEIIYRCEEAVQLPEGFSAIEALKKVESRAGELRSVIEAMVQLRDHGEGLTERLPPILDEYEEYRRTHPPSVAPGTSSD